MPSLWLFSCCEWNQCLANIIMIIFIVTTLKSHTWYYIFNKFGELPIWIWFVVFLHHTRQGKSINSNYCGKIIDELRLTIFTFIFWLKWARRLLLSLFIRLVNYLLSGFCFVQSVVQLLEKHYFVKNQLW